MTPSAPLPFAKMTRSLSGFMVLAPFDINGPFFVVEQVRSEHGDRVHVVSCLRATMVASTIR